MCSELGQISRSPTVKAPKIPVAAAELLGGLKQLLPFAQYVHSNQGIERVKSKIPGLPAVAAMAASVDAYAQLTSVDGGLGVYDSTNNVTWTSNADLFASQYSALSTIISDANSANGGVKSDPIKRRLSLWYCNECN
jgi:hypothetical protein